MLNNFIFRNNNAKTTEKIINNEKRYFDSTYFINTNGSNSQWTSRNYEGFAKNGYISNVIANRAITLISRCLCSVSISVSTVDNANQATQLPQDHQIQMLFKKPNPITNYARFMENVVSSYLLCGNVFIHGLHDENNYITEMTTLRADRINIIPSPEGSLIPYCYEYSINGNIFPYCCDQETGYSEILHIKTFNPLDDWYGLSPMESAQYSIDQHNECIKWNKALLENGARPSGALTVKGNLSEESFKRLKQDMQDKFAGGKNAGNIMILEGGLDWKEMSINPKDMEFSQTKDAAARDIATAFGVPSQLLGIRGDATYSNMAEARLALWEETVIPIGNNILSSIANWLSQSYNIPSLKIELDVDSISALLEKRQQMWQTVNNSNFLSTQEKRNEIGFDSNPPQ
jgi:HK97 family phage portal protein